MSSFGIYLIGFIVLSIGILMGVGMHIFIAVNMHLLIYFSLQILCFYVLFVDAAWLHRLRAKLLR